MGFKISVIPDHPIYDSIPAVKIGSYQIFDTISGARVQAGRKLRMKHTPIKRILFFMESFILSQYGYTWPDRESTVIF